MPTTNAVVSGSRCDSTNGWVTKSEPRAAVCTAFIENLGGAHMRGARAGADTPLLGGFKWLP